MDLMNSIDIKRSRRDRETESFSSSSSSSCCVWLNPLESPQPPMSFCFPGHPPTAQTHHPQPSLAERSKENPPPTTSSSHPFRYSRKHSVYPCSGRFQRPSLVQVLRWSPTNIKPSLHSNDTEEPGVNRKFDLRPKRGVGRIPQEITWLQGGGGEREKSITQTNTSSPHLLFKLTTAFQEFMAIRMEAPQVSHTYSIFRSRMLTILS